jgi:hypothetical protein
MYIVHLSWFWFLGTVKLSPEENASRGAKHMANTFALFENQPEVLFSFICKVD